MHINDTAVMQGSGFSLTTFELNHMYEVHIRWSVWYDPTVRV